jgi:hypothetical protein
VTAAMEREWPGIPVWDGHKHGEVDRPRTVGVVLPPQYWSRYCESCRGSHTPTYVGCSALRTGETRRCTSILFSLRCGREQGHLGEHSVFEDSDAGVLVSWDHVSRETLRGFHA